MGQIVLIAAGLCLVALSFNFSAVQSVCAFGASMCFGLSSVVGVDLRDPMGLRKKVGRRKKSG